MEKTMEHKFNRVVNTIFRPYNPRIEKLDFNLDCIRIHLTVNPYKGKLFDSEILLDKLWHFEHTTPFIVGYSMVLRYDDAHDIILAYTGEDLPADFDEK